MRIPIRLKLAGALALPMLALIGVAVLEVRRADDRADEIVHDTELATAAVGPGSLIISLQDERNYAGGYIVGMEETLTFAVESMDEARANTDAAISALEEFIAQSDPQVEAAFGPGLEAVRAQLAQVRDEFDASTLPRNTTDTRTGEFVNHVVSTYTSMIQTLIDGTSTLAFEVDDPDLRTGVELITLATTNSERTIEVATASLENILNPAIDINDLRVKTATALAHLRSQQDAMLERSRGPYEGMPEAFVESDFNQGQLATFDTFLLTGVADVVPVMAASNGAIDAANQLRDPVGEALDRHARSLVSDAEDQRRATIALATAFVVLAVAITLVASRSITNPLRSLTRQASEMATVKLPQAVQGVLETPAGEDVVVPEVPPITVETRDEVADVAEALNSVQTSALDLAVEQAALRKNIADSFVNLGRRNQNLLDRQLELITELERQEQQPERLEDLFLLDHLATRMRRNAESLLRLAGGGDSTSTGWGGPVPILDLVRGALGEVEEYSRVDITNMEPALVQAAVAADLAHAVAELVENALNFSPDHERVVVRGRNAPDGGYTIAVIDQGIGMTEEQLAIANRRLAGEESFTVAPSRYLGHYIAGHLANAIGLRISLEAEAVGGIVARVDIPANLLVEDRATGNAPDHQATPAPTSWDTAPAPTSWDTEPAPTSWDTAPAPEPTSWEPAPAPAPWEPAAPAGSNGHAPAPYVEREPVEPVAPQAGPAPEPVATSSFDEEFGPETGEPMALEPLPGGLTRRRRGANLPKATNVQAAFGGQIPAEERPKGPASADDVASFLSSFSSGVERGRSAAFEGDDL